MTHPVKTFDSNCRLFLGNLVVLFSGRRTPSQMSFQIRKLTSFPFEKLYYDLKQEVLKEMEPNDRIELVKVNAKFRSILLEKPWMVFGHHVDLIHFRNGIWLKHCLFMSPEPTSSSKLIPLSASHCSKESTRVIHWKCARTTNDSATNTRRLYLI